MPPNFNEADVSDKPPAVRNLPLLDDAQIADIQRRYRCELESLLSVDDGVKQVIDALEAKGDLDNTLIIYTSDNGYFHGEHRIPSEKLRIYEESIRVPLEMRGPGIPQGVTLDPLVTNADLAPTIVDAAGVTPGLDMDGRSLLPVIQKPGDRPKPRPLDRAADLEGDPHAPLPLRGVQERRAASSTTCRTTPTSSQSLDEGTRLRVSQVHASVPAPSAGELRRSRAASCTSPTPGPMIRGRLLG